MTFIIFPLKIVKKLAHIFLSVINELLINKRFKFIKQVLQIQLILINYFCEFHDYYFSSFYKSR